VNKKLFPPGELAAQLALLRQQGKRIVFTNGCFDLLHAGHIYSLTQAKASGDVLVVGINSDASVKRLKGAKRPILDAAERATVLGALEVVDYVTIFDEDTPQDLIILLQPTVLVKGGDWRVDAVVGKAEVESWGGKVVLIPYQDGRSTTNIIERVLEAYGENRIA
jgi:D-beta-D-heptose 7-phosphate kinase/D-beta-D-heptose 1-phosphate adenosyltransferase